MKIPRMTARDSPMIKMVEFIALPFRNPAKMYRIKSKYTEKHRTAPVVNLLMTSDAEKCSNAELKRT